MWERHLREGNGLFCLVSSSICIFLTFTQMNNMQNASRPKTRMFAAHVCHLAYQTSIRLSGKNSFFLMEIIEIYFSNIW